MAKKRIIIASILIIGLAIAGLVVLYPIISPQNDYLYGDFDIKFAEENMVNDYARQKTQLNGGVYDNESQSTFIPFSSGVNGSNSACSPYIKFFNHSTGRWSTAIEILQSPVEPDSHNYPSLLIDDKGYLHIFHTFHANHEIMYAKSKNPRDISKWDVQFLNGTEKATYGAAFQSSSGDFYLLVRIREDSQDGMDYEPEFILKSSDVGQTWTHIKLIDPSPLVDHWGTIYTKGVHYEPNPEGLHITFGVHQYHNQFLNQHFYTFFNFSDNHLYGVDGKDNGPSLEMTELTGNLVLFDLGGSTLFYNVRMAIDLDEAGNPHIFWAQKKSNGGIYLRWAKWNENGWKITDVEDMDWVSPFGLTYCGEGVFQIYAKKWGTWTYQYVFDTISNTMTNSSLILHTDNNQDRGFSQIMFIENAHPEILGFFIEGDGSSWRSPKPNGKLITFGF